MITPRLTAAEYNKMRIDKQAEYIRLLRLCVNILFFDHILYNIDGFQVRSGAIVSPSGAQIRVDSASFEALNIFLDGAIVTLEEAGLPDGSAEIVRILNEGNIYF